MVKIIHTADIHLDSPFSLFDAQKAQARKNELRGVFSSLIMYAKTEEADMVLIAGDLFDSEYVTKETMEIITSQCASYPSCKFVIAPGNHDPADERGPYLKTLFPENVYIFDKEQLTKKSFDDIGVDVYGWGYEGGRDMYENPIVNRIPVDPNKINILLAHADITGKSNGTCPAITTSDIDLSNCDYAALGHIHAGTEVKKAGKTYYAYSGCLEGRSFDECGMKGAIVCNFEKENGEFKPEFVYKRFCRRRYEKFDLDVTATESRTDVISKIKSELASRSIGKDTMLRVTLTGAVSPERDLHLDRISSDEVGVFYLEIKDKTLPLYSYEELKNDLSVKGALFRELLPLLESDDETERETAAQALRYGLAALSGSDIVDF
ncbi:MAG: DNA repair exonuclease [Clostridia bacterium]|nr:DNA repair exonuclease [Clostridia bacterium]